MLTFCKLKSSKSKKGHFQIPLWTCHSIQVSSPSPSLSLSLLSQHSDCSCDPIAILSDCHPSKCQPFFAVFFPLHTLLFFYLVIVVMLVEYKMQQKRLWRIILGCGLVAEFGTYLLFFLHSIIFEMAIYTLYTILFILKSSPFSVFLPLLYCSPFLSASYVVSQRK